MGRVRTAQVLAEEGLGAREVAKRLGLRSEYPARKALSHSENYSREELDSAIVRLAELDAAIKGASRLASEQPEDPPDYKPGVAALYAALKLPVVPIALNSGLYWRRREFVKHPGRVLVEFLEPIPAGLERKAFMHRLERAIETGTARLVAEARGAGAS